MVKFCVGSECLEMLDGRRVELKYYILEQEKFYAELDKKYISYGLEVIKKDNDLVERNLIEDITCDSEKINFISCKLKENKILPVHLEDVVIDMLS